MPSLLDYYRPQPRPGPFDPFNSRVTYYAPGPGDRMEGGFETSKPNPQTGKRVPSTLDDVRLGTSPFVTLAGDPSRYGQTVKMGPLTYTSPIDQKSYTLPDVTGYVHDTGSAFKGRPDKLDVAAGDYRGYSPQAASAAVTADAGRRTVTPLEGDEADRAMRPIGMPEPWRATGEGESPTETAMAQGPPPQQGRKMPNSLMDMFQPQDAAGQPTDLGGALTGRSQSLIGLGLGLLSPSNPLRGESSWSNALQGYMGGAALDTRTATSKAALAHQKMQDARQAAQDRQAQSNFERQFARSDPANAPTDFTRAARDLGLTPGTPEHTQFAKEFFAPKTEQPSIVWQEDANGNKVPYRQDPRSGSVTPIQLPGGTATAGGNPYGPSGKMTTDEGKTALFADRAATAHDAITKAENINAGASGAIGGLIQQNLPAGAANVLVSGERGKSMDAQRAFINALLRRESGAAINAGEFTSYSKEYFPQLGDTPDQIEGKRKHRAEVIAGLARESGKGYRPTYSFDEKGNIKLGTPSYAGKGGGTPAATEASASTQKKTINGKNYTKRDGQWFED